MPPTSASTAFPETGCLAVVDTVPVFMSGLVTCCGELGFQTVGYSRLSDVPADSETLGIVVALRREEDWGALAEACSRWPEIPIVVVVPHLVSAVVERALSVGACGVVDVSATSEHLVEALRAAVGWNTLLPRTIALELVRSGAEGHGLAPRELGWLQHLAHGSTVSDLASCVGYSEREMHRHLARVYALLDARGKTQALLEAQRLGLIL